MLSPGYQYRSTIELGNRPLIRSRWVAVPKRSAGSQALDTVYRQVEEHVDGRQVIKEMSREYMGIDYDIVRKNCCTFARDACLRLGVPEEEIPSWFRNLSESAMLSQDMARATVEPIASVLSTCEETGAHYQIENEGGYELISQQNAAGTHNLVVVMDTKPQSQDTLGQISHCDFRRNTTCAH